MASADAFAVQTEPGPIQLHAPAVSAVHPTTIATRAALINCDGRITDLLYDSVCRSLDTADADVAVSDDNEWSWSFHPAALKAMHSASRFSRRLAQVTGIARRAREIDLFKGRSGSSRSMR